MNTRVNALVTVNNSPSEVADKLGISEEDVVDWGNGYAVIIQRIEAVVEDDEAEEVEDAE